MRLLKLIKLPSDLNARAFRLMYFKNFALKRHNSVLASPLSLSLIHAIIVHPLTDQSELDIEFLCM